MATSNDEYRRKPPNTEFSTQANTDPPGTRYEDGSVKGGAPIKGSLADIGDDGFGIDFEGNGGRGTIVW